MESGFCHPCHIQYGVPGTPVPGKVHVLGVLCWYRFLLQLWVQLRREVVIYAVHVFNTRKGVK